MVFSTRYKGHLISYEPEFFFFGRCYYITSPSGDVLKNDALSLQEATEFIDSL